MKQHEHVDDDEAPNLLKVYKLVAEVHKQQQVLHDERGRILTLKKVVAGLAAFALILMAVIAKDSIAIKTKGPQEMPTEEEASTVDPARGADVKANASPASTERTPHGLSDARRRALPCFKAGCRNGQTRKRVSPSSDDRDVFRPTSSSDEDTGRPRTRIFEAFDLDYAYRYCSGRGRYLLDLEITDDEFDRINDAFFDEHETNVVLRFGRKLGRDRAVFQHVMRIWEGFHVESGSVDGMLFWVEPRLYCEHDDELNEVSSDCWEFQSLFIFEPCNGSSWCTVRTCAYGDATDNLEFWASTR